MLHRHGQLRVFLLVLGDLLTTSAALGVAYFLRFATTLLGAPEPWTPAAYLEALLPALALSLLAYAGTGGYRPPQVSDTRGDTLRLVIRIVLAATLVLATATLLYRDRYAFSRGMLALFPILGIPIVWVGRRGALRMLAALHRRGRGTVPAIVVGDGEPAEELVARLTERPWTGVRVVGRVTDPEELPAALESRSPEEVYLAWPADRRESLDRCLALLAEAMVDVRVVPDISNEAGLNRNAYLLGGLPVVTLRESPFHGINRVLKRGTDLILGSIFLLLAIPVMFVVALAILVTSGRPLLYRQERMGLDGRTFAILKFRSMRVDAEAATGAVWAKDDDPRSTPIGRVLRRFSLDELPQFVNVLRGEMSLVGPRPERPELIREFRERLPRYMLRHRIPAGLTGWAQVNGLRGDTDLAARLRYDLEYLERWSLLRDLGIIARTVWLVLAG
jgi:exopolysaccharide biosynthesis polyprenyl glycosylphosphotransferase